MGKKITIKHIKEHIKELEKENEFMIQTIKYEEEDIKEIFQKEYDCNIYILRQYNEILNELQK